MADIADEAVIVISNFIADPRDCNTKLKDQLEQLTDSNNKNKHESELEIEKKIEAITQASLETQQKLESEFKRKLKETEETYINKIRALIQKSIEIKEENETLKTKLKMHHNETLQISMLEQQNNLHTERIALIEKCLHESERKREISDDCIVSLKKENKMLENRVKLLNDRITVLENQNKKP